MKTYCTWINNEKNSKCFTHPNTDWFANSIDERFTFQETQYSWAKNPALTEYIWILEYPDDMPNQDIAKYKNDLKNYKIKDKTEKHINDLLLEWYNWEVTVLDFIFTDNRPTDNIL